MDRYTYKAIAVASGEWVYGDKCMMPIYVDYHHIGVDVVQKIVDEWVEGIQVHTPNNGIKYHYKQVEIDHKTLCKCTGLRDEENEIKVYESDIVSIHQFLFNGVEYDSELTGIVVYSDVLACYCIRNIENEHVLRYMGYDNCDEAKDEWVPICNFYGLHESSFTVIGNIHDKEEI